MISTLKSYRLCILLLAVCAAAWGFGGTSTGLSTRDSAESHSAFVRSSGQDVQAQDATARLVHLQSTHSSKQIHHFYPAVLSDGLSAVALIPGALATHVQPNRLPVRSSGADRSRAPPALL